LTSIFSNLPRIADRVLKPTPVDDVTACLRELRLPDKFLFRSIRFEELRNQIQITALFDVTFYLTFGGDSVM